MISIVRPDAVEQLQPFIDAGVLGPTEIEVVTTLARTSGETSGAVVLGAALAVRAPLWGHVCVDLSIVGDLVVVEPDDGTDDRSHTPAPIWPDLMGWLAELGTSPLTRRPGEAPTASGAPVVTPLVLDGTRLYLDRYWRYEQVVADHLLSRALAPDSAAAAVRSRAAQPLLDRFFGPVDAASPDRQREAAEAALTRHLTVIAGGPGTGKTRTVARLLAVVAELDLSSDHPLGIALAAPTGKAAARMTEAIGEEVAAVDLAPAAADHLRSLEATTIHRLLRTDGHGGFRHGRDDPLSADVLVIDETSMVSLPLMASLLDAVRPDAHLVLLGDPFQLASVEAGAVLGDLMGSPVAATAPTAIEPSVVVLERVHRFDSASAIGRVADAVRRGDADAVVSELRAAGPDDPSFRWVDPADPAGLAAVEDLVVAHAHDVVVAARSGDVDRTLGLLGELAVLSATRRGPAGVARWNQLVEDRLAADPDLDLRSAWYVGRPVMVTGNDRLNRVSNGDVGITVVRDDRIQVAFRGSESSRLIEPARLDRLDTWWAMTIHKSQGSEFGHVVVVLPPPPSPILTRELLYTAITRARRRVTVVASEAALRAAVERPVGRMSGLAERLRPTTRPGPDADGSAPPDDGAPLTLF